jgi:hypothetical protein
MIQIVVSVTFAVYGSGDPVTPRTNGKPGAPGETRTPNPQIRSLVLYPIELRAHAGYFNKMALCLASPGFPAASATMRRAARRVM